MASLTEIKSVSASIDGLAHEVAGRLRQMVRRMENVSNSLRAEVPACDNPCEKPFDCTSIGARLETSLETIREIEAILYRVESKIGCNENGPDRI